MPYVWQSCWGIAAETCRMVDANSTLRCRPSGSLQPFLVLHAFAFHSPTISSLPPPTLITARPYAALPTHRANLSNPIRGIKRWRLAPSAPSHWKRPGRSCKDPGHHYSKVLVSRPVVRSSVCPVVYSYRRRAPPARTERPTPPANLTIARCTHVCRRVGGVMRQLIPSPRSFPPS